MRDTEQQRMFCHKDSSIAVERKVKIVQRPTCEKCQNIVNIKIPTPFRREGLGPSSRSKREEKNKEWFFSPGFESPVQVTRAKQNIMFKGYIRSLSLKIKMSQDVHNLPAQTMWAERVDLDCVCYSGYLSMRYLLFYRELINFCVLSLSPIYSLTNWKQGVIRWYSLPQINTLL